MINKKIASLILSLSLVTSTNINGKSMNYEYKKEQIKEERLEEILKTQGEDLELRVIGGKYYSSLSPLKKVSSLRYAFEVENPKGFYNDQDAILMARLMLGEGEGTSDLEKIRIGYVAINRLNDDKKRYGKSLKEVILKPYQFTSFQTRKKILKRPMTYAPKEFLHCIKLSESLLRGQYKDPTEGAIFYFNPRLVRKTPAWEKGLKRVNTPGSPHSYYKE